MTFDSQPRRSDDPVNVTLHCCLQPDLALPYLPQHDHLSYHSNNTDSNNDLQITPNDRLSHHVQRLSPPLPRGPSFRRANRRRLAQHHGL